MNLEKLVGTKEKVQILELSESEKYYVAEDLNKQHKVYIENTGDYEPDEIIGSVEDCLIIKLVDEKLIGFIMTNRKFINDLKKIDNKLKDSAEYKSIKDIYLMERLKIKGKIVGLYMVDQGDIGKYYLDTIEIGTYMKKIKENNIIFKDKTIEDELGKQIRDVVQSIDLTKKEISLREDEEREADLIRKALGLEEKYIIGIATLDLKQKILDERQKDQDTQTKKRVEKNLEEIRDLKPELKRTNDINIKQEMELEDKVTDMKTLGQLLSKNNKLPQIEGKKFVKMGVIESDHRDELINEKGQNAKVNTTRYSFVAIASDGTVVPMDLTQDHQEGNNPREVNYQVNQKGQIEQDEVLSRFNIGQGTFAIKNGQYGEIKVYHSPRKTIGGRGIEGNKSLDRELETNNVWIMKKETRDLAGEFKTGYKSVERGYQEAKLHEDEQGNILEGDELRTEDIDGNENTRTHIHAKVDYDELATKWGYFEDGRPNADKAKELFEEKSKQNPEKDEKEIIEMVTEELEEQLHDKEQER